MAFSFFNTAPKLLSDRFIKLAKAGHLPDIMEAIYDERHNKSSLKGTSKNGLITVERLGSFPKK
ncbi:MAG: hypothetical protein ACRYFA_02835 [Janthinobacterium lividum]